MIMKGVENFGQLEACVMAIKAGVNMFIYRNTGVDVINIIERVCELAKDDEALKLNIEKSFKKTTSKRSFFIAGVSGDSGP